MSWADGPVVKYIILYTAIQIIYEDRISSDIVIQHNYVLHLYQSICISALLYWSMIKQRKMFYNCSHFILNTTPSYLLSLKQEKLRYHKGEKDKLGFVGECP